MATGPTVAGDRWCFHQRTHPSVTIAAAQLEQKRAGRDLLTGSSRPQLEDDSGHQKKKKKKTPKARADSAAADTVSN